MAAVSMADCMAAALMADRMAAARKAVWLIAGHQGAEADLAGNQNSLTCYALWLEERQLWSATKVVLWRMPWFSQQVNT